MNEFEDAVERAKHIDRPPWRPWSEIPELETDNRSGHWDLEETIESGRCGYPLKSVYERTGEIRWCTMLPMNRMGRGDSHTSRFCHHHEEHEPESKSGKVVIGEFHHQVFVEGAGSEGLQDSLNQDTTA